MPTVQGVDLFAHGDFTVPGGGSYVEVTGTPVKDTTIVRPGDPASILFDGNFDSSVGSSSGSMGTKGWHAFAWYLKSTDEPAVGENISQFWTTGFGNRARLYYLPGTDEFSHTVDDNAYTNFPAKLDAWNWIEQIFDVGTTTFTIYTRVNGVDTTPQTATGVATTVQYSYIGKSSALIHRFSHHMWGTAASTTDWYGEPAWVLDGPIVSMSRPGEVSRKFGPF